MVNPQQGDNKNALRQRKTDAGVGRLQQMDGTPAGVDSAGVCMKTYFTEVAKDFTQEPLLAFIAEQERLDAQKIHDIKARIHRNLSDDLPVEQRAANWLKLYPDVEREFNRLTWEAINAGRTRIGAKCLAEVLRWNGFIKGGSGFKLNNIAVSLLARRFMDANPQYPKLFETRSKA